MKINNFEITGIPYVDKKYMIFIEKYGYIPPLFNPYNVTEIIDYAPTQTTQCGSNTSSSTVMIMEISND